MLFCVALGAAFVLAWQRWRESERADASERSVNVLRERVKELEEKIEVLAQERDEAVQSATRDPLTRLHNRLSLNTNLPQLLAAARRHGVSAAILYCDLDGFKAVNDDVGHAAGDHVLKTIAERLRERLRTQDIVARLGGDEFVIVLSEVMDHLSAAETASRILRDVLRPIHYEEKELMVGMCVGICIFPSDAEDAATLLEYADRALRAAKRIPGKNTIKMWGDPNTFISIL